MERGKEAFSFVGSLDWNQSSSCRTWDQLINLSGFPFPLVKWGWFDLPCKAGGAEQPAILCSRIHCICFYSTRLREVITRDLLPSSAMIKDLSQEFGLPLSQEDLRDGKLFAVPPQPAPNLEDLRSRNSTFTDEIHAHQEKYLQWRNAMMLKKSQEHSLIQVGSLSPWVGGPRPLPHLGCPVTCQEIQGRWPIPEPGICLRPLSALTPSPGVPRPS